MQPMSGLFGGSQLIPREGDRVVVAFHEGRTDRGVILGTLYDEQYRPPYMGPPDRSSVLPGEVEASCGGGRVGARGGAGL